MCKTWLVLDSAIPLRNALRHRVTWCCRLPAPVNNITSAHTMIRLTSFRLSFHVHLLLWSRIGRFTIVFCTLGRTFGFRFNCLLASEQIYRDLQIMKAVPVLYRYYPPTRHFVFPSRQFACKTFTAAVPLHSLDFLLSLASVTLKDLWFFCLSISTVSILIFSLVVLLYLPPFAFLLLSLSIMLLLLLQLTRSSPISLFISLVFLPENTKGAPEPVLGLCLYSFCWGLLPIIQFSLFKFWRFYFRPPYYFPTIVGKLLLGCTLRL